MIPSVRETGDWVRPDRKADTGWDTTPRMDRRPQGTAPHRTAPYCTARHGTEPLCLLCAGASRPGAHGWGSDANPSQREAEETDLHSQPYSRSRRKRPRPATRLTGLFSRDDTPGVELHSVAPSRWQHAREPKSGRRRAMGVRMGGFG
jgi:hypothetical protein